MGALQEALMSNRSTDIVCATNHNRILPYEIWTKELNASCAGKSGPVTTIPAGRTECDRILSELGVVHRGYRVVKNSLCSNDGQVHNVGQETKKISNVQPKDLTLDKLRCLINEGVDYKKIMEIYNTISERYFRERLKELGYRLYMGQLYVIADRLWLKSSNHTSKGLTQC